MINDDLIKKRNDMRKNVYDKLNVFKQTNRKVFFYIYAFNQFRKGYILDLNLKMATLVLKEDVLGETPFLFEEIDSTSIDIVKIKCGCCLERKEEYVSGICKECANKMDRHLEGSQ